MQIVNIKDNFSIMQYDTISKSNLMNFNQVVDIHRMVVSAKLSTNLGEINFLKRYLILTRLFKQLYNQKICILRIFRIKFNKRTKRTMKQSYAVLLGVTIRKDKIFESLNYFYNIIWSVTKKYNDQIKFYKKKNSYVFEVKYLNYILGFDDAIYVNSLGIKLNYSLYFKGMYSKLYEKFFFKKL